MMTGCPPEDELVRMVEGALGDASLAAIESHVDRCEQCASVIANLGALGSSATRPRVVGRYQLESRIGGGGMGEVWRAWDPQLRREIAVKLVRPEHADDGRERERLLREARALARLGHPNVLAVYDVGEIDGEVFIATELVAGDTLATRGGVNADWRQLVRWYSQAARGLAAAHAAGLVHRDIKPANLLVGGDNRVRVADFGLAVKSATPSPVEPTHHPSRSIGHVQITQTGYIAGTPAYMSPEQRLGEPADARADQYALCVALTEAIAGRRPPLDIDRDAMIAFISERRERDPDLDGLCGVLARGLSIDRDDRFPGIDALADALDACVAPASAPTENMPLPAPRSPRRRGRLVAIAGLAAVAGVASVLVIWRMQNRDDEKPTPIANVPVDTRVPVDATVAIVEPIEPDAAPAPSVAPKTPVVATVAPTAKRPTSNPPDVQQQIDLGLAAARRATNKRDGRGCLAEIAKLPTNVPIMSSHTINLQRGQCEMLVGRCAEGIAMIDAALDGIGSPPSGEDFSVALCPITGPYETRVKRIIAQVHREKAPAICKSFVKAARTLAGEAKDREKPAIAGVLRHLAECVGDCTEATSLWKLATDLDGVPMEWTVKGCAAPPKGTTTAAAVPDANAMMAFSETLRKVQLALPARDLKACRELIASPPKDVPAGMEMSLDMIKGQCMMLTGNCKGGSDLLVKAYGGKLPAASLESMADNVCPIEGSLDSRLRRMKSQLLAFADKRGAPRITWCNHLLAPAKTAANEVQTGEQRIRAADVLQHLAWCVSTAGRCAEANELWSLSIATDPHTHATPKLSTKCP